MKKINDWLYEWLPSVWGFLWIAIITFGSVAILIAVVKLLLSAMGVL